MEFPRLVYKSAANHTVANDAAEFDALIARGWFASVPEALAGPVAVAATTTLDPQVARVDDEPSQSAIDDALNYGDDDAPPTRAELELKANELGIEFSPRIGDAKLAERIADAIAAQG